MQRLLESYRAIPADATVRLTDGREKIWGDVHHDEVLDLSSLPKGEAWQVLEIKGVPLLLFPTVATAAPHGC